MIGDLQHKKASYYFSLIDEDENGLIEADDFRLRAERMAEAQDVTDEATRRKLEQRVMGWWNHLCALADIDDDDRVTREEWETYWERLQVAIEEGTETDREETLASLEQAAKGTFRAINTADSGQISEDEYADWLEAWGVEDSSAAFQRLDRNGTGSLSEEDLAEAVKEFYLSNDPEAPGNALYGELPE